MIRIQLLSARGEEPITACSHLEVQPAAGKLGPAGKFSRSEPR